MPSAASRPPARMPRRSARRSASSRYWVVSRTAVPASRSRRTSSQSAAREIGSRPVVGSSRKTTSGARRAPRRGRAGAVAARQVLDALVGAPVGQVERVEQLWARAAASAHRQPELAARAGEQPPRGRGRVDAGLLQRHADRRAHPLGRRPRRRGRPRSRGPRSARRASRGCPPSSTCPTRSRRAGRRPRRARSRTTGPATTSRRRRSAWPSPRSSITSLDLLVARQSSDKAS